MVNINNDDLIHKTQQLVNFQNIARETKSPFAKAAIAEKAIEISIEVIGELVAREVARG